MRNAVLACAAFAQLGVSAQTAGRIAAHYDLSSPTRRTELPRELTEISALTDVDERTVACVQDEAGAVFFVEHATGRVISRIPFAGPGDYEGLARVGGELYVLRSDGLIHHIGLREGMLLPLDSFRLQVPEADLEALCYDGKNDRLLIAPKSGRKGHAAVRDQRAIYGWDRAKHHQPDAPVLELGLARLSAEARALGVTLPSERTRNGREEPLFKLRASSICVHPLDDTIWILCAVDFALVVVDRNGHLIDLVRLDPRSFPQAEGLTFLPNGDLLISNEGHGRPADLLLFARKP